MDQGFNVFQNILESHPDLKALFSCNDNMALGAIEAITAARKTGQIIARTAIRDGFMEGSVAQYPSEIGKLGVENASALLIGEKIPDFIATKIELITKDNLDTQ